MKTVAVLLLLAVAELSSCAKLVYRTAEKSADTECTACQVSITELQSLIQNSAIQDEIRTAAEQACTLLPSELQSTCHQYIDSYYQLAIKFLLQQNPLTLCQELHLCQSTTSGTSANEARRVDISSFITGKAANDKCTTCKTYFAALEKYVTDPNFIKQAILFVTNNICPRVIHELPDCDDVAKRYVPLIFSLLQQVSPDAVCGFLGLCPKQTLKVQDDCNDCELFAEDVQELVSDPNEQVTITELLTTKVCPLLASAFPQCTTYVQEYVPIALQLFSTLSPSSVCQTIYWCSSSTPSSTQFGKLFIKLLSHLKSDAKTAATASPAVANDPCADCQNFIIDAQKKYIDQAEQQKLIDLVVDQLCPEIANVFSQCADYAKDYMPIGFEYLDGLAPQQTCVQIGFCKTASPRSSASELPWQLIKASKKVGDSCNDCQQFIADAQHFYAVPQNQQVVIDLVVNSLCPVVSSYIANCAQLAQQQIPVLFMLFEEQDPTVICKYIGLCGSSQPARALERLVAALTASRVQRFQMTPRKNSDDQYCDHCKTFFIDLLAYYKNPDNQQKAIDELVSQVCPLITQQFPSCTTVLPEYLPLAFELLSSLSPDFICTQLHFCSSSTGSSSLASFLSSVSAGSLCTDCELVVEALRVAALSNKTVEELIDTVVSVCNIVAEAGRPMCFAMLRATLHEVVYTFKQSTNKQVCGTFFPQCGTPGPAFLTPIKN